MHAIHSFTIREYGAHPHSRASNHSDWGPRGLDDSVDGSGPVKVLVKDGKPVTKEGAELLKKLKRSAQ